MKIRASFYLLGAALLMAVILACATGGAAQPIGNATGTATATAPGFGGDVTVTITMEEGFITEITAEGPGESATIGGPALLRLPPRIKRYNSAQVDATSGSSITSFAIREAAQKAIDEIVAGQE